MNIIIAVAVGILVAIIARALGIRSQSFDWWIFVVCGVGIIHFALYQSGVMQ